MKSRSGKEFRKTFLEILGKKTLDKITVSEIIEKSGYSRSSFYRNYEDYYDFVEKIIREEAEKLTCMLIDLMKHYRAEDSLDESILCDIMKHVYEEKVLYHMIFTAHNFIASVSPMNFCLLVMNSFRDAGNFNFKGDISDIDEEFYRYAETLRFIRYLFYWDSHDYSFSPEYMAKQIVSMDKLDKAFEVMELQV